MKSCRVVDVVELAREMSSYYEGMAREWAAVVVDATGKPKDPELRRVCRRLRRSLLRQVAIAQRPDDESPAPRVNPLMRYPGDEGHWMT
jgi:hypothetical protein